MPDMYRYFGSPETLACGLPVVAGAETDRVDPKAEPDASMLADGRLIKLSTEKPLAKRTVPELRKYAAARGIDLGDATSKDEVLAVITEHNQKEGEAS